MYSTGSSKVDKNLESSIILGPHMYSTGSSKVDKSIESS